jgi:uncharacterized protein YecE (DUF72 family)
LPRVAQPPFLTANHAPGFFVGTSGWAYATWKPGFYPEGTPARRFLEFYASKLTSVEVNYTFNKLPSAAQLQGWLDEAPSLFRFSFKAPQRITHFQRLRNSQDSVAEFLAALEPARLSGKMGSLLFQLPPNFKADIDRLSSFLKLPAFDAKNFQLAFEFRHASWFCDDVYNLLREHNAALCIAESDDLQTPEVCTASFRYYRLRKNGGYTPARIKTFAEHFAELADGNLSPEGLFIYLKHEDEPTGALNATALLAALDNFTGVQA